MSATHRALVVRLSSQERLHGLAPLIISPLNRISIYGRFLHDSRDVCTIDHDVT